MGKKLLLNTVGKGENAGHYTIKEKLLHLSLIDIVICNAFNLDKSKILLSGKGQKLWINPLPNNFNF